MAASTIMRKPGGQVVISFCNKNTTEFLHGKDEESSRLPFVSKCNVNLFWYFLAISRLNAND